jgi:transposase-like protein
MDPSQPFKWRRFQAKIILLCVRWYLRYPLSYRDLEEMMRKRGLHIDHTMIYRSRAALRTRTGEALQISSQSHERLVARR